MSRGDTPITMPISAGLLGSVILDSASKTFSVLGFSSAIYSSLKAPLFLGQLEKEQFRLFLSRVVVLVLSLAVAQTLSAAYVPLANLEGNPETAKLLQQAITARQAVIEAVTEPDDRACRQRQ